MTANCRIKIQNEAYRCHKTWTRPSAGQSQNVVGWHACGAVVGGHRALWWTLVVVWALLYPYKWFAKFGGRWSSRCVGWTWVVSVDVGRRGGRGSLRWTWVVVVDVGVWWTWFVGVDVGVVVGVVRGGGVRRIRAS